MDKILGILKQINDKADFEKSNDFFDDNLIDSLGIMLLVQTIEEEYNIQIEGEDIVPENLYNIQAIQHLLNKYGV